MINITYKRASSTQELEQILALQKANSKHSVSNTERKTDGFVTVQHTLPLLREMNKACPHVIATKNNVVIGYALSMTKDFAKDLKVLQPMFTQIDTILDTNTSYLVMGQICVAKEYRRQGIFRGLYSFMQKELNTTYNVLITEVDETNIRSIQAHYAVGFTSLHKYFTEGQQWDILVWNWQYL